jgi:glucokinase
MAREAVAAGTAPAVLAAAGGDVAAVRGEHVTDLLDSRDPGAVEIFTVYAGYVALGVANLILLLDPDVVVLGGGVSAHADLLEELVGSELSRRFPTSVRERDVRVVVGPGGPESGALGAAILAAHAVVG